MYTLCPFLNRVSLTVHFQLTFHLDPQPPDVTHTAQSRRYTTGADRVNRYNQVSRQTSDDGMSKFLNKLITHCKSWKVLFYFCIFGEFFA